MLDEIINYVQALQSQVEVQEQYFRLAKIKLQKYILALTTSLCFLIVPINETSHCHHNTEFQQRKHSLIRGMKTLKTNLKGDDSRKGISLHTLNVLAFKHHIMISGSSGKCTQISSSHNTRCLHYRFPYESNTAIYHIRDDTPSFKHCRAQNNKHSCLGS